MLGRGPQHRHTNPCMIWVKDLILSQMAWDNMKKITGSPQMEFTYKNCVFILIFKLQSPSKYSPFVAIHWILLQYFWTHPFWCLLVLLPFFVSPLPHWQNISFWGIFSSWETNKIKSCLVWDKWIRRVGHRGHAVFGQKLLNTKCSGGRCAHKLPIMKWANVLKESSKRNCQSQTQPLITTPTGTLIQMSS